MKLVIQILPVEVLRVVEVKRDVRFELIDSDSARCIPQKVKMQRDVADELIFSGLMKPERQALPPRTVDRAKCE